MAAMFVAALAVPEAFGRHGVIFGVAFLLVSVMHLAIYALSSRATRICSARSCALAPWSLAGATLIFVAGFVDADG